MKRLKISPLLGGIIPMFIILFLRTGIAGTTSTGPDARWRIIFSPNPDSSINSLAGVAGVSENDAGSVGGYTSGNTIGKTLIEVSGEREYSEQAKGAQEPGKGCLLCSKSCSWQRRFCSPSEFLGKPCGPGELPGLFDRVSTLSYLSVDGSFYSLKNSISVLSPVLLPRYPTAHALSVRGTRATPRRKLSFVPYSG